MRATNSPRRHPAGFTLVELLVVISIIGILMGLLLGAVQKVRDVGRRTTTVSEINQLDMAATKFKLDFGFNPPHRIRLPGVVPDTSDTTGWQLAAAGSAKRESYEGFRQLLQMFPRWQVGSASVTTLAAGTATGLSFRGTAAVADENGLPLEGSQCLVFFLGGPDLQGFKPIGPYDPGAGATSRKGPYYDFQPNRLNPSTATRTSFPTGVATATVAVPNGYLNGYLDPYSAPYAYFSTSGGRGYDPSYCWSPPATSVMSTGGPVPTPVPDYVSNVPGSPVSLYVMRPYQEAASKWLNADRCQIISAGKNKVFGPGTEGTYTVAAGLTVSYRWTAGGKYYALDSDKKPKPAVPAGFENGDGIGGDDLANFNGGAMLGAIGS